MSAVNPGRLLENFPNGGEQDAMNASTGAGTSRSVRGGWFEVPNSSATGVLEITVPKNERNFRGMQPGAPLKIVQGSTTTYAIVNTHTASTGVVTIHGPNMTIASIDELYWSYLDRVVQKDFRIHGYWDTPTDDLLKFMMQQSFRWDLGRGYMVYAKAITVTEDNTTPAEIDVTIGGVDAFVSPMAVLDSDWVGSGEASQSGYAVDFGDAIAFKKTTFGGTGDSEDLSVSFTVVLDETDATYEPASPDPWVNLIIGPTNGGTFLGLGEGVHAVSPTSYLHTMETTSSTVQEVWKNELASGTTSGGTGVAQSISMSAYSYNTSLYSVWKIKYTNGAAVSGSFATGIDGVIKDRLFQSGVVINGVTFTWQRGGALWG